MKKKILLIIISMMAFETLFTGCGKEDNQFEIPPISYEDKSQKLSIDWNQIVQSVKEAKFDNLYVNQDELESDIHDFGYISFMNYDPLVDNSFKSVEYQVGISYGVITKEDGSTYDEAVYEFMFLDNHSDNYYVCVYTGNKEKLSSEGEWFLETNCDEAISGYIDELNQAMNLK